MNFIYKSQGMSHFVINFIFLPTSCKSTMSPDIHLAHLPVTVWLKAGLRRPFTLCICFRICHLFEHYNVITIQQNCISNQTPPCRYVTLGRCNLDCPAGSKPPEGQWKKIALFRQHFSLVAPRKPDNNPCPYFF